MSSSFDDDYDNEKSDNMHRAISKRVRRKLDEFLEEEIERDRRTFSYYEALRKTNPARYWSEKTQRQMHKDIDELQEAFLDDGRR